MKVLLDENLDRRLRTRLGPHDISTAIYMGWAGTKNGKLLEAAEASGFDLLLTGDQTLSYEQNLTGRKLAVIVLSSVEWRILKNHLPQILEAVNAAEPGSFRALDCGRFTRKGI